MKKEKKKKVTLNGMLLSPLIIGQRAVFSAEGNVYYTSPVVAVRESSKDHIRFETMNTHYHLLMSPFPLSSANLLPAGMALCA